MLDGLKAKLGFASAKDQDDKEHYDDYAEFDDSESYEEYGEGYDEYDEYGADYNNASHARNSSDVEETYSLYAPVTTRATRTSSTRRSSRTSTTTPKLVSIDDVRARTQVPDSLNRDPLPPRRVSTASTSTSTETTMRGAYRGNRTMVDSSMPASLTPEGTAAAAASASASSRRDRSAGLNSLFEPTDIANDEDGSSSRFGQGSSSYAAASRAADAIAASSESRDTSAAAYSRGGFDPYDAYADAGSYAGAGATVFSSSRSLSVVKPSSYGDAERIAKVLKAGDVVILALRNTPDSLSKRILDFSFGVASALDANVEYVADKVFVVMRGDALTDAERMSLRGQGVI